MMASEKSLLLGICPECGEKMKEWTQEEISAWKIDLGMGDDEDFFACCSECNDFYLPH